MNTYMKLNITFCHRKPERSLFWKGKQFPVCARCTGIHIGYLSMPIFMFNILSLDIWVSILIIIPTILDGFTQAFLDRESNNSIRLITGFFAGVGAMSLLSIIGKLIGIQLKLCF